MTGNLRRYHRKHTVGRDGSGKLAKRMAIAVSIAIPVGIALSSVAYGQSPTPPSPSPSSERPGMESGVPVVQRATLQVGSEGADVLELQAALKLLGFYRSEVTGRYDEATAAAVAQFQQAAGLPADGVMRPASWSRLFPSTATLSPPLAAPSDPQVAPIPASAANPPSSKSPPSSAGSEAAPPTTPNTTPGGSGGEAAEIPASPSIANPANTTTNPPTTANTHTGATGAPQPAPATVAATTSTPPPIDFPILRQGMHGPAVVRLQERLRAIGVFDGVIDGVFGAETQAAVKAAQTKFQVDPDGVVGPMTWTVLLR